MQSIGGREGVGAQNRSSTSSVTFNLGDTATRNGSPSTHHHHHHHHHSAGGLASSSGTAHLTGSSKLWTPVTIFCAAEKFQTTFETLHQYPNTQLARLFSPPYPLFDEHNQAHMLPPSLCPHPIVFSCILEWLRTGQWMMTPDPEVFDAVCETAVAMGLPVAPPKLLRGDGAASYRYEHQTVKLPVPFKGRGEASGATPITNSATNAANNGSRNNNAFASNSSTPRTSPARTASAGGGGGGFSPRQPLPPPPPFDPTMNTCQMLSLLGYKGFMVVSEDKARGDDDGKFMTEVTMRRKLPTVKGVEMLAQESILFQKLLGIV